jgi:hypothetical protein
MKILKSIVLSVFIAFYPLFSAFTINFFTHQLDTNLRLLSAVTSLIVIYLLTDILFKMLSNNKTDYIKGIIFIFIVGSATTYNQIEENRWNQYETFLLTSYLISALSMLVGYWKTNKKQKIILNRTSI